MTLARTVAGLLLTLCAATGCAADPEPQVVAPVAAPSVVPVPSTSTATAPSSPLPTAAAGGVGCTEEPSEVPVCRLVVAVLAGDLSRLGDAERQVATSVGRLPAGGWALEACELVGDVTVACEVSFDGEDVVRGFTVVPVNTEYADGSLTTQDGEEVRYEVSSYDGTGRPGSFTSP